MKRFLLLIGILGSVSGLFGANLPERAQQETINDFSGGLNTLYPAQKIANNYSPFIRNVFIDEGIAETVNGYTVLGSSRVLNKITGVFPYNLEDGTVYFLVTDSSVTLETRDFASWTFVSSNSNSGALLTWFQVRNKMWGVNGVDFPITWDHTTKTILNGTGGTPNVPKFKYGEYYDDRVWGFGIPGAASDLYFTSVITTDSVVIAPDDSRAWPAINAVYAGRGDGTNGTSLFVYDGRLRAGKEKSIYTITGDDPSNYRAVKEESGVGIASDESIVILDQNFNSVGPDGIYSNAERISDLITPDVDTFVKSQSNILSNTWESQADFAKGQFFGSTATADGILTQNGSSVSINNISAVAPAGSFLQINSSTTVQTDYGVMTPTFTVNSTFFVQPRTVTLWMRHNGTCTGNQWYAMIRNSVTRNQVSAGFASNNLTTSFSKVSLSWNRDDFLMFDGTQLNTGKFEINIATVTDGDNMCVLDVYAATDAANATIFLVPGINAQFMSEVSTLASVTSWGIFDSLRETNGGTINFFTRTSTSAVNITTKTWEPTNAGVTLSAPLINNYIQWAATMTGTRSGNDIPTFNTIDNVTIDHVQGVGAIARAIGIDWKNRYWLSVSTIGDTSKRQIYVKSRITNKVPDAWMPIDGMDMCAFAKSGDVFYGGSCSTGIVYRLDYGTNFDGRAISSIYKTPSLTFGSTFFDKEIMKYLVHGEKNTGGVLTVGTSINGGSVTNSTFSVSGTGLFNRIVEGVRNKGKTLDLTFTESDLDQKMRLHEIFVIWEPTQVLSNK